jgi:hypothetical protein
LPSLRRAREQAKIAVCTANLKGMSTAALTYSSDDRTEASLPVHQGVVNPSNSDEGRRALAFYGYGGKAGRGEFLNDTRFWGTFRGKGPATRPLNKFLFKDGFVDYSRNPGPGQKNWKNDEKLDLPNYRCPSDTGYKGLHYTEWRDSGLTSYDHFGTSYAVNALWVHYVGGSPCMSNSPFWRPLSRVPNPANTLYYMENVGHFAYHAPPNGSIKECPYGTPWEGVIEGWHGRPWMFQASFTDAHSATIRMKGYANPRLEEYPTGDLDDPEGSYDIWKCVIIRGNGWQKDTLPAPVVWTDIDCPD